MSDATIIDVSFTDAETGNEFLRLKMTVRQLPQREATMTLSKVDWLVVDVTPSRTEDIVKSGKVSLVLRKVQYVDPKTILFSLPTVADVIPEEVVAGEPAFRMHEDDWLQLELVPQEVVGKAQPDLDAIKAVLATEREKSGFKRLHIRKALPSPFAARPLLLKSLREALGAERTVAYRSSRGVLKDCFAFGLPSGVWLYGQSRDGLVVGLGMTGRDDSAMRSLEALTLIDWCTAQVHQPSPL